MKIETSEGTFEIDIDKAIQSGVARRVYKPIKDIKRGDVFEIIDYTTPPTKGIVVAVGCDYALIGCNNNFNMWCCGGSYIMSKDKLIAYLNVSIFGHNWACIGNTESKFNQLIAPKIKKK